MKLTWQIITKDLRYLRGWLGAWMAVLALPVALAVGVLREKDVLRTGILERGEIGFLLMQAAMAYVLVLRVVHADGLVGTRQFWRTRPIGRGRLLAAKAGTLIVVLGFLPLLVLWPWWLACGFRGAEIAEATAEWWVLAGMIALPAAFVGSITDSLARSLLWSAVLGALVPFGALWFGAASPGGMMGVSAGLVLSRQLLAAGVVGAGFLAVVLAQFLARRRTVWLVTLGILLFIGVGVASRWPLSLVATTPLERFPERAASLQVTWEKAVADKVLAGTPAPRGDRLQRIELRFVAVGAPEGYWLAGAGAGQHWQFGREFSLDWKENLLTGVGPRPRLGNFTEADVWRDPETRREILARGADRVVPALPPDDGTLAVWTSASFRPSLVARMRSDAPAYHATLWFELIRPVLGVEVQMAPGKWIRGGGSGVRVVAVEAVEDRSAESAPSHSRVHLVDARPVAYWERLQRAMARARWFRLSEVDSKEGYVIVNRTASQFIMAGRSERRPRTYSINGVQLRQMSLEVAVPRLRRDGRWVPAPGWEDPARMTLAHVTLESAALVAREVDVARFHLED